MVEYLLNVSEVLGSVPNTKRRRGRGVKGGEGNSNNSSYSKVLRAWECPPYSY